MIKKRLLALTVSLALLAGMNAVLPIRAEETGETDSPSLPAEPGVVNGADTGYAVYRLTYQDIPAAETALLLDASSRTGYTGGQADVLVAGREKVAVLEIGDAISWKITVPAAGRYQLEIDYCALPGRGLDCAASLTIDGVPPFSEAGELTFSRVWKDAGKPERDAADNDIRPQQEEVTAWQTRRVRDTAGYTDEEFWFYLPAGEHVVTLTMVNESMAVSAMRFQPAETVPTYQEYAAAIEDGKIEAVAERLELCQAEEPLYKSHSMIYATSDYSSPATVPSDPTKIRLNTLGQSNWQYSGQWVVWNLHVEKAGYYRLAFKYRQDFVRGKASARRLTVNDKVPFQEAACLSFAYNTDFQNLVLGDGKGTEYLFWLEEGNNRIGMEVVIGSVSEVLIAASDIVTQLNDQYRQIIMITGTQPDQLRDYYLDRELPGLLPAFTSCAEKLRSCVNMMDENGNVGSEGAIFDKLAAQLESFVKNPETIQKRLDSFKNNVSTLASTVLSFKEQSLELDYLMAAGVRAALPSPKAGLFSLIAYRCQAFLGSFVEDYNAVGYGDEEGREQAPVSVWANGEATGRDQLAIISRLIVNDFTSKTGIPVQLRLVGTGQILTQAILAGVGPDVALIVPEATPINLSMRGALADLSKFDGFEEMKEWFFSSAFIPYAYEGGIYGMPETQTFSMLFYRKDIFEEVGARVPTTWDDFFVTSAILQKNKLDIGIPESVGFFETLMLQNGGDYYNGTHTRTGFDSPEALDAFSRWTSFYSEYSYPLNFDAYNRFRTGEMPMVIMPISFYNQLVVAAPEIRGKWEMAALPGERQTDGGINRTQSATGTCAMMMADAASPDNAFAFIRWWVGAETQAAYGNEVEAQMGTAARYSTANIEAFRNLPWTAAEQEILFEQWEWVSDVPIVPGDYYVGRNLSNAFRRVVFYGETPREVLNRYNAIINKEILRKRKEYGLNITE